MLLIEPRVFRAEDFYFPLWSFLYRENRPVLVSEAYEALDKEHHITDVEKSRSVKSGGPHWKNTIRFARLALKKGDLAHSVKRGVWQLTPKGISVYESLINMDKRDLR